MYDRFNRHINYLRISVTDKCNLRCTYCMPEEGVKLLRHEDILSFEEIIQVVKIGVLSGIHKIRITGGEPLIRKGIVNLVSMIANINGVTDLSLTTNGTLLDNLAQSLADAGLQRINISLDTMNPEKYTEITRGGNINNVFKGIEAARQAKLSPIKINCVINKSPDEVDAKKVAEFCSKNKLHIRYIHKMNLETGNFSTVEGGTGGNCKQCNRLRLTANGMLKPCLFSDTEFSIRKLGIEEAFNKAIETKPEYGSKNLINKFHNIGG